MNKETKAAFTLIELLVVVLIIGILATVAVPQYKMAIEKAHFAEAATQVKAVAMAEKIYQLANGSYTTNWADLDLTFEGDEISSQPYQLQQTDWFLSVANAISRNYVHAGRQRDYLDGRWYIVYYFSNDKMYCRALEEDTKAQRICKTFGTQITCPSVFFENDYCSLLP